MITLIEWSDEYSVGVNSLDKEHKKLIDHCRINFL